MTMIVTTQNGSKLELFDNCISSGGQGSIYKIKTIGYEKFIVKIYHIQKDALALEKKIQYMVDYSPFKNAPIIIQKSLAWPETLVYKNHEFVGYLMPIVQDAIELTELTFPKPPHNKNGNDWEKFNISNKNSFRTRLTICYNISRAIELLHISGRYTLVDLKPENIMVNKNGIVTVIDLDSIQVSDRKGKVLFKTNVYTEEYAPPEFYNDQLNQKKDQIETSWDVFSFAVICYKLFLVIHPFQASHQKYNTIADLIKYGYFVHGNKKKDLHVIPRFHKRYGELPQSIQNLFVKTFENGFKKPSIRPDLSQWVSVFSKELSFKHHLKSVQDYSKLYNNGSHRKTKVYSRGYNKTKSILNITINNVYFNDKVELKWKTTGAIKCKINNSIISLKGSLVIPLKNNFYVFEIFDKNGNKIEKRIDIIVPNPIIDFFTISNISPNRSVVNWNVRNATKVYLNNKLVNNNDKIEIILDSSRYILKAVNISGKTISKSLSNPHWFRNKQFKIKQTNFLIKNNREIKFNPQLQNIKQNTYEINSKY